MPDCPLCDGDGQLDMRDEDAIIGEMWTQQEIDNAVAGGFKYPAGISDCPECEGTGTISEDRLKDIEAISNANVQRAIAKLRDQGLM